MVGEGAGVFGGVAEVEEHEYLLIVGEAEQLVELVGMKAVDPA